jgi:putative transposase
MKTSYHTAITVAFYLNCLPPELSQYIPRSTRFDWQHKDKSTYFGHEWFCQNQQLFQTLRQVSTNKRLLQINKTLIRVIAIKRFITIHAASIKNKLFSITQTVLFNITKVNAVFNLTKTLRLLQLPYSAYLKLKKTARCNLSPMHLCIVKHPAQLLKKEVAVIKHYCSDTRFLHWQLASVYEMINREGAAYFNINTFYKYVTLLKLNRPRLAHCRKYGPVKAFIENSQYPAIQHLIVQRDIEFSNSMIEAANFCIITILLTMTH